MRFVFSDYWVNEIPQAVRGFTETYRTNVWLLVSCINDDILPVECLDDDRTVVICAPNQVIGHDGLDVDALPDLQHVARILQLINSSLNMPEWLARRGSRIGIVSRQADKVRLRHRALLHVYGPLLAVQDNGSSVRTDLPAMGNGAASRPTPLHRHLFPLKSPCAAMALLVSGEPPRPSRA